MSARPGAPAGVEDILTEILAELRAIRAQLGQATITEPDVHVDSELLDTVSTYLADALHPGKGVSV